MERIGAAEIVWETAQATWPETAPGSRVPMFSADPDPITAHEETPPPRPGSDPWTSRRQQPTAGENTDTDGPVTPGPAAAIATEAGGEETTAVTANTVVVNFENSCWVDIRDSERKYELTGLMKQGDRRVLGGKPPYSFKLGDSTAVRITVGGAPFDLRPFSRGNVARFTLNPDELP